MIFSYVCVWPKRHTNRAGAHSRLAARRGMKVRREIAFC